jgi:cystathionine beta-synthase
VQDKNSAERPTKEIMGNPYPIVQMGTTIEEVSKLFSRDNAAVLIDLEKAPHYYKIRYWFY